MNGTNLKDLITEYLRDLEFCSWVESQISLGNIKQTYSKKFGECIGGRWREKHRGKSKRAKRDNISFSLTLEQYLYLAFKAGLNCPEQIGVTGDPTKLYNLARYEDRGDYSVGNCRFITHKENRKERDSHYVVSEETKRKIAESNKGRKLTPEQRKNISKAQKGRVHSQETKDKMSKSHKGLIFSEEHRKKISKNQKELIEKRIHNFNHLNKR